MHDVLIDTTTDVAKKFPNRARKDGRYYACDFTYDEIRSLRVTERFDVKTGKPVFADRFPDAPIAYQVPSLEEEFYQVQGLNKSTGRNVKVYVEVKEPAFFEAHGKDALHFLTSHAEKSFFDIDFGAEEGECYLVFGRESCGLGKEVIEANREHCFRLPMVGGMRSLNLSNSVAITVYEYWRQLGFPSPFRASSS